MQVQLPLPGEFSVQLTFTDIDGASHSLDLESFAVELEDLFMPVVAAQRGPIIVSKWRDPFAKLLEIPRAVVEKIVEEKLNHFLVSPGPTLPPLDPFDFELEATLHTSSTSDSPKFLNVLIRLPPEYHLMMRFMMGPSTTVVWICTDFPDVLVLLDNYFDSWTKGTTTRITNDIDRLISG